ncbi:RagB/SusD family nutrient uptake outer membrane protein [Fodinibius roseus]|uniref:RagB/SusD family nutrient uptake outer membrane protein n=1 Tax=Fodinibius roseus TaxID=1194090 RepID=UPI00147ACECF|nr:RagB/SusD family nutrient uptake outer membrane protein [Fodinibius roseus]
MDTTPQNTLNSEIYWQSEEDAFSAVNAIYNELPGVGEMAWDRYSDIGNLMSPSGDWASIQRGEHGASTGLFQNYWDSNYQTIGRVNYFLENVDKVQENDPAASESLLTRLQAEARVIRAMTYMRMSFWFGDIPLVTSSISVEEGRGLVPATREEIVDFIDNELTQAAGNLPVEYASSDDIGRITKGAALGLKARAMIYNNRWSDARDAALEVMNLGVYDLYDSYENLFGYAAQNNDEVILDRQYTRDDHSHSFFEAYAPRMMNGSVGISPTRILVDAYETENGLSIEEDPSYDPLDPYSNRDPRLEYTLFLPTFSDDVPGSELYNGEIYENRPGTGTADEIIIQQNRTNTGFNTRKYVNPEDMSDRSNNGTNFILLRYADILLMYAEAKIELNEIDASVYDAINEVRQRPDVNMPEIANTGQSQEEMREIVRNERMVELAMEGLRYWDVIRWRIAEDVLQGNVPGMDYIPVGETEPVQFVSGIINRHFDPDRHYLWPIPEQELTINSNLTQNPGY